MATSSAPVPPHLPRRLAICYYGWDWFTSALPDEAYGDLDRALRETRARGFNCIRPDLALGLLYDQQGRRRSGRVPFRARLPGANSNLQCQNGRGGAAFAVGERVLELFALAQQYDLYIIGTSWLYQDFLTEVDDAALREELAAISPDDRLMFLARQWDGLLTELEGRGYAGRLAMVELLNELDCTPISAAAPVTGPLTFADWLRNDVPAAPPERRRDLAAAAVAYLRARHPDVLVTVDYGSACHFATMRPDNAQVADHHVYTDGITQLIMHRAGVAADSRDFAFTTAAHRAANDVLREVFTATGPSWAEVCACGQQTRPLWWVYAWFYQNLDNARYDQWCVAHYDECRARIQAGVERQFAAAAAYATAHRLPLVVDEGYIFYPPLNSRFVTTPAGRWGEELAVDAAIRTGHWGIMPTGYFRPNTPLVWYDDDQCQWIRGLNQRILASGDPT